MKVSELNPPELDYWVAKAENIEGLAEDGKTGHLVRWLKSTKRFELYSPSIDWSQGGPIIERERIYTYPLRLEDGWWSTIEAKIISMEGPTPLIAAMRAYVASKYGEDVD